MEHHLGIHARGSEGGGEDNGRWGGRKGWGALLGTMAPEQICSGLAGGILGEKDHCHEQQGTAL